MKKYTYSFALIVGEILLSACSATGPKFTKAVEPTTREALVYIYRPDAIYYGGIQSHFYVDGKKVASLNKEGYSAFYLSPGIHNFKQHWPGMDNPQHSIQFQTEFAPGETRYFRQTIAFKSFGIMPTYKGVIMAASHEWTIATIPESEALSEIGLTHFQPPVESTAIRKVGAN